MYVEHPEHYAGFIFDCDGTLADSMPLHHEAWVQAFRSHGATFEFPYALMCAWGGKGLAQTVEDLNRMHGTQLVVAEVLRLHSEFMDAHLDHLRPRPEILEEARRLAPLRPLAVASGGHRHHVQRTLKAIGATALFPVVVTQDDVPRSKPAPDLFLLAAARMGVDPARCLVFEDSPTGVEAAQNAGMACVRV